jgi:hypothetical protein
MIYDGPNSKDYKTVKKKDLGFTYVFRVQIVKDGPWLLKVGKTGNDPKVRRTDYKRCGFHRIEEHQRAVAQLAPFYWVTEKLVHKELESYRKLFQCKGCSKTHREFFEVPEDVALKSVSRWRMFCKELPWDETGRLTKFWTRRLRDRTQYHGDSQSDETDESRRLASTWQAFTELGWFDLGCYAFDEIDLAQLAWPAFAIFEAYLLAPTLAVLIVILLFVLSRHGIQVTTSRLERSRQALGRKVRLDSWKSMASCVQTLFDEWHGSSKGGVMSEEDEDTDESSIFEMEETPRFVRLGNTLEDAIYVSDG